MVQSKVENIDIKQLIFDPLNPRIPKNFGERTDDKNILDYMLRFGNLPDLLESIAETGYSEAEPLLVVKNNDDKYIVVEGNRRLAAVKIFNDPSLATIRTKKVNEIIENAKVNAPSSIPCLIYKKRDDVLDYLGYRHITGVKEWGALEKARYLDQLYNRHPGKNDDDTYQILAKMTGSRSNYVKNLHMALKLYDFADNEAWYNADIDKNSINFSWITTCLGYTGISDYLGYDKKIVDIDKINKDNLKILIIWLFDEKKAVVKESRNISQLSIVLSHEEAKEKLLTGYSLSNALLYTDEPERVFMKLIESSKDKLLQAKESIEQLNDSPENAYSILEEISKLSKSVYGALKANFDNDINENNVNENEKK